LLNSIYIKGVEKEGDLEKMTKKRDILKGVLQRDLLYGKYYLTFRSFAMKN